jgi:hypothetical protein
VEAALRATVRENVGPATSRLINEPATASLRKSS